MEYLFVYSEVLDPQSQCFGFERTDVIYSEHDV